MREAHGKGGIMKEIEICGRSVKEEHFCEMIMMELIPIRGNEDKLKKLPCRMVEDLALVYRLDLAGIGLRDLSALISYDLLELLDLSEEDLVKKAERYAPRTHPAVLQTLQDSIAKISGMRLPDVPEGDSVIYVASVENGCLGAGVIGYPGFLEEAALRLGGSFFILPSSIHELLFLKDDDAMEASSLNEMVQSVNRACVSPEEQLSDHVYYYDARECRFYSIERDHIYERKKVEGLC